MRAWAHVGERYWAHKLNIFPICLTAPKNTRHLQLQGGRSPQQRSMPFSLAEGSGPGLQMVVGGHVPASVAAPRKAASTDGLSALATVPTIGSAPQPCSRQPAG